MTVEFRPGVPELVDIGEGVFIYIPAHLIHRESVAAEGEKASSSESAESVLPL
jgi:hypothetical protein